MIFCGFHNQRVCLVMLFARWGNTHFMQLIIRRAAELLKSKVAARSTSYMEANEEWEFVRSLHLDASVTRLFKRQGTFQLQMLQ